MVVNPVLDSRFIHAARLAHAKVLQRMTGYHTGKRANLSEEQREEIVRRYVAGETSAVLAAEFGCTRNYPSFLATKYVCRQPKARNKKRKSP